MQDGERPVVIREVPLQVHIDPSKRWTQFLGQLDTLTLERARQPPDGDIIHPPTLAVHRDLAAGALEDAREVEACDFAPLAIRS
jgi:hypothetical protein